MMVVGVSVMAGASLSGCNTVPKTEMTPAVLTQTNDTSMTAIKTAAAEVLGKTNIALGASDLLNSPTVSILPQRLAPIPGAPFSQHDFAVPTLLTLMTDGTNCFLVKEDTGEIIQMENVNCRPLQ